MDNNFSPQVKEIISFSREEALRLGNDFIGTEHLLLGLIRDGDNTAIKVLKQLNVDLYELRKEVELAVKDKTGKNIANINSLPLTKQAEKVWEYQGAGVGMRFLFALLRPHTRYYAVHAMADLTSQSPIPSFQNRRN